MTWNTGFKTKLPDYFYNIADRSRWFDKFGADPVTGEQREVLSIPEMVEKRDRGMAYRAWLHRFGLKAKNLKFQRIRILNDNYVYSTSKDWWPKYHGAIFTVWMQPETMKQKKNFIQFYILSPEDSEMVARYEQSCKGATQPPRDLEAEPYVTENPKLKICYIVPVKCCHHLRNETFAGKIEYHEHL